MATQTLSLAKQLTLFASMATRLGPFLRDRLSAERCVAVSRQGLAAREQSFLAVIEQVVSQDEQNPYSKLLKHAGITPRDVRELVPRNGLEPTLEILYDYGVYVSLDEFKGRTQLRAWQSMPRCRLARL